MAEAAPGGWTGFALDLVTTIDQVAVVVGTPLLGLLRDLSGGFTAPWAFLLALVVLVRSAEGAPGAAAAVVEACFAGAVGWLGDG